MKVWFEGSTEVECTLEHVKESLADLGEHYLRVVRRMPGLSQVDLVSQTDDAVTIKTNEGVMTRTNIVLAVEDERVVVEFDEEYQAGKMVTATAHFLEEFTVLPAGVQYRTVIAGMEAPGLLGFLYRNFGSSNIGKAFLKASKESLESK